MKQTILGILGGGQLGRMSALAAARLGTPVHIFTPEDGSPAAQVAARSVVGAYNDRQALKNFAAGVDVITYEFENIPVETIIYLKTLRPVFPDERLLEVSQNRIDEKSFLNGIGIPTARWTSVKSAQDIHKALQDWNSSKCILKTVRFGYDGKGQFYVKIPADIETGWSALDGEVLIAEEVVEFTAELSVIIARDKNGKTITYGPMLNEHKNHILHKTTVPAGLPSPIENEAKFLAEKLAQAVDLIGILTIELFLTADGRLLANEIAPRTHNSGHWSIDACVCSQFENHVRAVCGLPLGDPAPHSAAEMVNLIGHDAENLQKYLEMPRACVHLYGKTEIREGRKMGHVTILKQG